MSRAHAADPPTYRPTLGLFSTTMLVVGGVIGSGIFLNPAIVAQRVGSARLVLLVWGLGALVALAGGLIYGELGARRPAAGGPYVYLRDAWGPLPAFLYGWALFFMIATGAIAAVAVTSANYLLALVAGTTGASVSEGAALAARAGRPVATALVLALTVVNCLGVAPGAALQSLFTVLKLLAIGGLVLVALLGSAGAATVGAAGGGGGAAASAASLEQAVGAVGAGGVAVALATALVPVLFAFGGWQQTGFVAAEVDDAPRTLPRAMVVGVLVIVAAYLLVNVAYLRQLGAAGLAASTAPAADTMARVLGPAGRTAIAVGIVVSTVGFLDLVVLATPRVYQAMAADGLFFRAMATLHPRFRTPVRALLAQGVLATVLVWSGSYGELLDYVVFADWIFFGLTAAAVFVFRRREGAPRGARIPGHPWPTLLFLAASAYVLVGTVTSNPSNALRGVCLIALGVPAYAYWRRRADQRAATD